MLNYVVETITLSPQRNEVGDSWGLQGSFQGEADLDWGLGGLVRKDSAGGRRERAFQEREHSEQG